MSAGNSSPQNPSQHSLLIESDGIYDLWSVQLTSSKYHPNCPLDSSSLLRVFSNAGFFCAKPLGFPVYILTLKEGICIVSSVKRVGGGEKSYHTKLRGLTGGLDLEYLRTVFHSPVPIHCNEICQMPVQFVKGRG